MNLYILPTLERQSLSETRQHLLKCYIIHTMFPSFLILRFLDTFDLAIFLLTRTKLCLEVIGKNVTWFHFAEFLDVIKSIENDILF